ncbi:hypothetical protein [Pseudomonas pseudonitroreducens]|nr:hypothetical protein [Pseudomonas pseudonitroreducens]
MPSIAGMAIICWLTSYADPNLSRILALDTNPENLTSPKLILLILYGNLFCYIASYPILGFHATRAIDYKDMQLSLHPKDPYILSFIVAIASVLFSLTLNGTLGLAAAILLTTFYSGVQIYRIFSGLKNSDIRGLNESTRNTIIFSYAFSLAQRRGILEKSKSEETTAANGNTARQTKRHWHKEFIESYRHLREHGNSAFIFFLELVLASLIYLSIKESTLSSHAQLSTVGIILAIWATPAILIHLLGQLLERRFSQFDTSKRQRNQQP